MQSIIRGTTSVVVPRVVRHTHQHYLFHFFCVPAAGSAPPAHLKGELPGDFGFDPLGLGADPAALKWHREAELVHCRWAMLAVAGATAVHAHA